MQNLPAIACWMLIIGATHGYRLECPKFKNPEAVMNLSQIISYYDYPNEQYDIVTKDGYILSLYRIPRGKGCSRETALHRPVVYLQHGLFATAFNWISNLPHNSLAYILADAGFDVWLGNSRGNTWSQRHVTLSPNSKEFWAFSFDEMAIYDLPAAVDFIVKKTGQEQLYYVGHSQGTTIGSQVPPVTRPFEEYFSALLLDENSSWLLTGYGFIAFSTDPKLAQRIKMFFAMAPVVTVKYIKRPSTKLFPFLKAQMKILLQEKKILPHSQFYQFLATKICNLWIFHWICQSVFLDMIGSDCSNLNMSRIDVYFANYPAGTSVQNIFHWAQLVTSEQLQAYDWGNPVLNMIRYNQVTPPVYNVNLMTIPTILWSGGKDVVADPLDVDNMLPNISNLIFHKRIPHYGHMEFILGLDTPQQIYYEIVNMIKKNMQT